jgi:hypothetical protein
MRTELSCKSSSTTSPLGGIVPEGSYGGKMRAFLPGLNGVFRSCDGAGSYEGHKDRKALRRELLKRHPIERGNLCVKLPYLDLVPAAAFLHPARG